MSDTVRIDPAVISGGQVGIVDALRAPFPEILQVNGRIGVDENRTVRVGAIAEGRIVHVYAGSGDSVREGQRLADLHSQLVHEARANYAKASAELQRCQAELAYARELRDRTVRLKELKAASLEQVQRAETDLQRAGQEVIVARAEMRRIEEQLVQLGLSTAGALEEYGGQAPGDGSRKPSGEPPEESEEEELVPVRAPIGGVIIQRLVTPGTVVTPASDLFVVSDLDCLWVNAEVPEKYLPRLKTGLPVEIEVQAWPGERFPARLTRIGDVLDPATRTARVRCETTNTPRKLKPEMYATVNFTLTSPESSVSVPAGALQEVDGRMMVFVQTGESQFRAVPVKTGRTGGGRIEILDGLAGGEKVAETGSFLLQSELLNSQLAEE